MSIRSVRGPAEWLRLRRLRDRNRCLPRDGESYWLGLLSLPIILMKKLLLLCGLLAFTAALSAAEDVTWTTDYKAALAQAKAQNRHVFLFFTGSDWCSWCK